MSSIEFPTRLRSTNIQHFLTLVGNEVTNHSLHSASIEANIPIPLEAKYYFYEIIIRNTEKGSICLGLIPEYQFTTEGLLGKKHGYGLRSDGRLFSHMNPSGIDWSFCSTWGNAVGETIGCGIIVDTGEIFYTKGSKCCGVAFTLPPEILKRVLSSSKPFISSKQNDKRSKSHQLVPCVTVGANRKIEVGINVLSIVTIFALSEIPNC